ncbi:nucleotide-binding domain-containing protein [Mycena metata]|uniref:Nucleotide-binding domain-containing protein n=1 Tax=Mycena metata TaxID=1033252 RepID=A0AAD7MUW6_9AGAR|nr:nucleotide-binding domain-containing protein [Mycena metata]
MSALVNPMSDPAVTQAKCVAFSALTLPRRLSESPALHIDFNRDPLIAPKQDSPHILVIGAGIVGMSAAWTLLDSGYKVTVLASQFDDRVSGQHLTWEYPPAVCGHTSDVEALEIPKRWSMVSYHVFKYMAATPLLSHEYSVVMRDAIFFFEKPVEDDVSQLRKMREIERSGVAGFLHDKHLTHSFGIDSSKYVDAYKLRAPMIDTDVALTKITKLEAELLTTYKANAIVNATGLGAGELADDKNVYPLRGAMIRVLNNSQHIPKLTTALAVSAHTEGQIETKFIFIVPRGDGIIYTGGFSEPDVTDTLAEDDAKIEQMGKDDEKFLPGLSTKPEDRDPEYPVAQGLRPARRGDVLCQRELTHPLPGGTPGYSRIVHCYGHAGAGWSLSFGSALEVKTLVNSALAGEVPEPMHRQAPSAVSREQVADFARNRANEDGRHISAAAT